MPHVRSAADATAVVDAARYGPLGRRPVAAATRAAGYGLPQADGASEPGENDLVFVMIEDTEGVANIAEIIATPGIDGVLVGTWDLAVEMGKAGYGPPAPEVMSHVETVLGATREAGLLAAAHGWSASAATSYVELGCQVIIVSLDSTLLLEGLRSLREVAESVEGAR